MLGLGGNFYHFKESLYKGAFNKQHYKLEKYLKFVAYVI